MVARDSARDAAATSSAASTAAASSATASAAAWPAAATMRPAAVSAVTASWAAASSTSPAVISARTAAAAAADWIRSDSATASAASALAAAAASKAIGLIGLGLGDHRSCLFHGGDLGSHHQPGLGGQETLADQRAAGLGDGVEKRGGPVVLHEQEGQGGPRLERIGQSPRIGRVKGRRPSAGAGTAGLAVRHRNDRRQERAEVLVITDGQLLDGAVLAFSHEKHVEQAKNPPAAQTVDLGQDPVLGTGVTTEAQRDHLQRCGHRCPPLFRPVMPLTVPPGSVTASAASAPVLAVAGSIPGTRPTAQRVDMPLGGQASKDFAEGRRCPVLQPEDLPGQGRGRHAAARIHSDALSEVTMQACPTTPTAQAGNPEREDNRHPITDVG